MMLGWRLDHNRSIVGDVCPPWPSSPVRWRKHRYIHRVKTAKRRRAGHGCSERGERRKRREKNYRECKWIATAESYRHLMIRTKQRKSDWEHYVMTPQNFITALNKWWRHGFTTTKIQKGEGCLTLNQLSVSAFKPKVDDWITHQYTSRRRWGTVENTSIPFAKKKYVRDGEGRRSRCFRPWWQPSGPVYAQSANGLPIYISYDHSLSGKSLLSVVKNLSVGQRLCGCRSISPAGEFWMKCEGYKHAWCNLKKRRLLREGKQITYQELKEQGAKEWLKSTWWHEEILKQQVR